MVVFLATPNKVSFSYKLAAFIQHRLTRLQAAKMNTEQLPLKFLRLLQSHKYFCIRVTQHFFERKDWLKSTYSFS